MLFRAIMLVLAMLTVLGCARVESRLLALPRLTWETPLRADDVWIELEDGGRLHGWLFLPQRDEVLSASTLAPGASASGSNTLTFEGSWDNSPPTRLPAVLYLHGRTDSIAVYRDVAADFADTIGAALFMVDYRGWGRSSEPKHLGRRSLAADARASLAALRAMPEIDPARIAVWGSSMGGHPATGLFADEPDLVALVLWASPADSKWLLADHSRRIGLPAFVAGTVALRRWREPRREIARLSGRPVMIVHGLLDGVVPIRHGIELANRGRAAGAAIESHTDLQGHDGVSEAGLERIGAFLRRHLGVEGKRAEEEHRERDDMPPARTSSHTSRPTASTTGRR